MVGGDPIVSVIIVTHNSGRIVKRCIRHLRRAMLSLSCEVVVVDNGSSDDTPTVIRQNLPEANLILNAENVGFARACNQGAAIACGRFLLFLNPDVAIDSDAIEALVAVCEESESVGLASGRLRFPDGRFQGTCREFPSLTNLLLARGSLLTRLPLMKSRFGYTRPDCDETTIVPAVAATMVMVRKKPFEKVGGFDERFFLYMEDTDLSYRMSKEGYVNLFVPHAGGVHEWGTGSATKKMRRTYLHHVAVWKYLRKHYAGNPYVWLLFVPLSLNFLFTVFLPDYRGNQRR